MIERIVDWNVARNLHIGEINWDKEWSFITEELCEGLRANDTDEKLDAMADIVVFALGAMYKAGYNPDIIMDEVLKHIESRRGYFDEEQQKFIKTTPKDEMYQTNFERAKR